LVKTRVVFFNPCRTQEAESTRFARAAQRAEHAMRAQKYAVNTETFAKKTAMGASEKRQASA
jgi:cell fate (sporulation/competence/biofilm development) regulator YmcA (YheA/YmcA/DUF963 family)